MIQFNLILKKNIELNCFQKKNLTSNWQHQFDVWPWIAEGQFFAKRDSSDTFNPQRDSSNKIRPFKGFLDLKSLGNIGLDHSSNKNFILWQFLLDYLFELSLKLDISYDCNHLGILYLITWPKSSKKSQKLDGLLKFLSFPDLTILSFSLELRFQS